MSVSHKGLCTVAAPVCRVGVQTGSQRLHFQVLLYYIVYAEDIR